MESGSCINRLARVSLLLLPGQQSPHATAMMKLSVARVVTTCTKSPGLESAVSTAGKSPARPIVYRAVAHSSPKLRCQGSRAPLYRRLLRRWETLPVAVSREREPGGPEGTERPRRNNQIILRSPRRSLPSPVHAPWPDPLMNRPSRCLPARHLARRPALRAAFARSRCLPRLAETASVSALRNGGRLYFVRAVSLSQEAETAAASWRSASSSCDSSTPRARSTCCAGDASRS